MFHNIAILPENNVCISVYDIRVHYILEKNFSDSFWFFTVFSKTINNYFPMLEISM